MTPENKQRVRDAFQKAIDRDPVAADLPIEGWRGREGTPKTSRELIGMALSSDDIFNRIDQTVAAGAKTFETFLKELEKTRFPFPSRAPKNSGWRP